MKNYCLSLIFSFSVVLSIAQDVSTITGLVTDQAKLPIANAFVCLNWSKKGLLTREDGSFYISATSQDTLVIKHLSFEPKAIAVSRLLSKDTIYIQLTEKTVTLGEVTVTNWGEWKDFKHRIAHMDADSIRNTGTYRLATMFGTKKSHPIKNPYFRGQRAPKLNPLTIIGGIFSGILPRMIYNKYSKTEKMRRKIQKELLQDIAIKKNSTRYSKKLIGKLLKIEGAELNNFKIFCDYAIDLNLSDYKLAKQTKSLYKEWNAAAVYQLTQDSTQMQNNLK